MSRFFKSAAFPILIVVVLAFFAQKLIGNSSHTQKHSFGNMLSELQAGPECGPPQLSERPPRHILSPLGGLSSPAPAL